MTKEDQEAIETMQSLERWASDSKAGAAFRHIMARLPLLDRMEVRLQRLKQALEGLIGGATREELAAIEVGARMLPAAAQDRAVALDAIHALQAELDEPE